MGKVVVTADKHNHIISINENKPEWGYIRVEQEILVINNKGWLRKAKRSAFINGKVEDLVETNYKKGDTLDGKIIVEESLKPFNPVNPEKNLKIAGDTGVVCSIKGQPIYRQCYFTPDEQAKDVLISHDNSDEIIEAQK